MLTCVFEDGHPAFFRHAVADCIVVKENDILLVKRSAGLQEAGKWALAGGYVERDETLAEAAAREVFEETGYRISAITLLRIVDHPRRPREDRQNIAFVFFCAAGKKEGAPDWESETQQWFPVNELPPEESMAFDHCENIALYKKYLASPFPLPILGS